MNPSPPDSVVVLDDFFVGNVYLNKLDRTEFEENWWYYLETTNLLSKDKRLLLSYEAADAYDYGLSVPNLSYGYGFKCKNGSPINYAFNPFYYSSFDIDSIRLIVTSTVKQSNKDNDSNQPLTLWDLIQANQLNKFLKVEDTEGDSIRYFDLTKYSKYRRGKDQNLSKDFNNHQGIYFIVTTKIYFFLRGKRSNAITLEKIEYSFDLFEEVRHIENFIEAIQINIPK